MQYTSRKKITLKSGEVIYVSLSEKVSSQLEHHGDFTCTLHTRSDKRGRFYDEEKGGPALTDDYSKVFEKSFTIPPTKFLTIEIIFEYVMSVIHEYELRLNIIKELNEDEHA